MCLVNFLVLQVLVTKAEKLAKQRKEDAARLLGVKQDAGTFRVPCVPLLPCLGIYSNVFLCAIGVGKAEWALFLAFECVGVLFYACYGYQNS